MCTRYLITLTLLLCLALSNAFAHSDKSESKRDEYKSKERVEIKTSYGNIIVEVYPNKAPVTASNFLRLVDRGVYNNASFYRVVRKDNQPQDNVKIEVIQGGLGRDYDDEHPDRKTQLTPIIHETTALTGLKHQDGTLSMARNSPGSASSEFFICINKQPALDYKGKRNPDGKGFAAFGKVIKGMKVVKTIQALNDTRQYLDKPVKILSMKRIK